MYDTFIQISDILTIQNRLHSLDALQEPLFGKMSPQHMVEHLSQTLQMSTGKIHLELKVDLIVAERSRRITIYTDKKLPPGIKFPLFKDDDLPPLMCADLPAAISDLTIGLNEFEDYFKKNPAAKPVHPVLGALDHPEWTIFHRKHFTHHFRQFGLIQ